MGARLLVRDDSFQPRNHAKHCNIGTVHHSGGFRAVGRIHSQKMHSVKIRQHGDGQLAVPEAGPNPRGHAVNQAFNSYLFKIPDSGKSRTPGRGQEPDLPSNKSSKSPSDVTRNPQMQVNLTPPAIKSVASSLVCKRHDKFGNSNQNPVYCKKASKKTPTRKPCGFMQS